MNVSPLLKTVAALLRTSNVPLYRNNAEREDIDNWLKNGFARLASATDDRDRADSESAEAGDIKALIMSCTRCTGTGERKMPYGDGSSGLFILLNPPALLSSFEMNTFRKESKDILYKILRNALSIEPEHAYITNLIKCTLKDIIRPSDVHENCLTILENEIGIIAPKTVLVMGDMLSVRRVRKKTPQCNWFEIPHPVLMIQTPDLKRQAWETLKLVKSTLDE